MRRQILVSFKPREVAPRRLADDLNMLARGLGHNLKTALGLDAPLAYSILLGVVVSLVDDRSSLFGLAGKDRAWLASRA